MAIDVKGHIKIVEGKAYVHPLTIPELEFLLETLANARYKLDEVNKVLQVTRKLRTEYKLLKKHLKET